MHLGTWHDIYELSLTVSRKIFKKMAHSGLLPQNQSTILLFVRKPVTVLNGHKQKLRKHITWKWKGNMVAEN